MAKKTGVVKDMRYLRHSAGFGHPESPERLAAIYEMLDNPLMAWKFIEIEPREATHKEIETIHTPSYVEYIAGTAGQSSVYLDPDTATSPESYEIAKLAVGGVCNAIDSVMEKKVDNAFALVRPPGHHAEADSAAGFCIFNNIAIGAMHAILKHHLKKILIVDWDLHHGNGTQHSFYSDPRILYFSTHQYPYYPGTGSLQEIGQGKAEGYTINVPLSVGAGDASFVKIFRKILQPVALKFKPQLVLLSAGFDTYYQDPLGGMRVTADGFAALTRILMNIAESYCNGRFVAVLEGGYHLAGLTQSVKAVLEEMRDDTHYPEEKLASLEKEADENTNHIIKQVISKIKPYWKL
ncbi:MAG: histone deacetylase [Deltaproteobacteria bacterium RBG_16_44_11]|nr:MAG: histone deacetylase [Deltaproteobacteria bacterium RBG_16_44_11]